MGDGAVPEPVLSEEEQAAFAKGLAEFNHGLFFECHDTLEELWSGARGPSRDFLHGLIQAAVGFYHLGGGNRSGAMTLLRRALARLDRYPTRYGGVELDALRASIGAWLGATEVGAALPGDLDRPQIRLASTERAR